MLRRGTILFFLNQFKPWRASNTRLPKFRQGSQLFAGIQGLNRAHFNPGAQGTQMIRIPRGKKTTNNFKVKKLAETLPMHSLTGAR